VIKYFAFCFCLHYCFFDLTRKLQSVLSFYANLSYKYLSLTIEKDLVMKVKIITSLLLSSLGWNSAQADVLVMGNETALIKNIANQYNQNLTFYKGEPTASDLLYVNVASLALNDYQLVKKAVIAGNLVVLDVSGFKGGQQRISVTKQITGLGMAAPILVSGTYDGDNIINAITNDVTDENGNTLSDSEAELKSLSLSLTHALTRFNFGGE